MKKIIQIALVLVILVLCVGIVMSVMKPIDFNQEKSIRYDKVIAKLKDIRKAEKHYKDVYGGYTGSFDVLIDFVKNDSLPLVRKLGSLPDTLTEALALEIGLTLTELPESLTVDMALAQGYIIRDTTKISVLDSIFDPGYPIDSIRYVPFTDNIKFKLAAGEIVTGSKVKVKTFEASALNDDILDGLDKQLIINLNATKDFPGLKVGSMAEPNLAGNWE